jgi:uncharacterized membrane protein (DUF441 family)
MKNDKRKLIFSLLSQVSKSKTVTLNALIVGFVITFLGFKGIDLSAQEAETLLGAVTIAISGVNIFLRFITKKPLMEKTKLME